VKNTSKRELERSPRDRTESRRQRVNEVLGERLPTPPLAQDKDRASDALERAEKRVMAVSFLLAKLVSLGVLLAALVLLEAGVVKRIWETEFRTEPVHAQSALTTSALTVIKPGDLPVPPVAHARARRAPPRTCCPSRRLRPSPRPPDE
jgi:hypothetical protein